MRLDPHFRVWEFCLTSASFRLISPRMLSTARGLTHRLRPIDEYPMLEKHKGRGTRFAMVCKALQGHFQCRFFHTS